MKINDIIVEQKLSVGDSFSLELGNFIIETGVVGFTRDGVILESDAKTLAMLRAFGAKLESTKMSLTEGRMAEVDIILQDLASGNMDIYQVMNNPQGPEETYAADKLKDMYDAVSSDYNLNPDDDFEEIIDIVAQQLADEYGIEDVDQKSDVDAQEPYADADQARETGDAWDDPRDVNEAEYQGRKVSLGKPMAGDVKKSKVYVKGPKGNVVKVNFGDKKMKIKKSNPKRRKSFRARHHCENPGPRWKARYWSCRAW